MFVKLDAGTNEYVRFVCALYARKMNIANLILPVHVHEDRTLYTDDDSALVFLYDAFNWFEMRWWRYCNDNFPLIFDHLDKILEEQEKDVLH